MFCFDVYAGNRSPFVCDRWLYLGLFQNVDYEATSQLTFVSFTFAHYLNLPTLYSDTVTLLLSFLWF